MCTTDPAIPLVPADTVSFSAMNGVAMIIIYGTAFVGLKELSILVFQHCTAREMAYQFVCLRWACIIHVVNQALFYLVLPVLYIASQVSKLSTARLVVLSVTIFFLNALELYIGKVTWAVMRSRQRKAGTIPSLMGWVDTTRVVGGEASATKIDHYEPANDERSPPGRLTSAI